MSAPTLEGWDRLRHGGLLLDPQRLGEVAAHDPGPFPPWYERELRKVSSLILGGTGDVATFVALVLHRICGFNNDLGTWHRGPQVGAEWGRPAVTGDTVKPRQLWLGREGGVLPVFFDSERRVGVGRGRRRVSHVLQWLRAGDEQLALLTNGRQFRLIFAGLDFDAWCEWDLELWFEEGELSTQVAALRTMLQPALWTPPEEGAPAPLLQAVLDSRKGQAALSQLLGERVREAVELIVQGHDEALRQRCPDIDPAEVYRAAVRVVMRLVVVLFAETRELLPRDNALYHVSYGLTGLLEELEKIAARGGSRLARTWSAWPRVLALFRLVHDGSHHPDLPVPAYGGELFAPGDPDSPDGLTRALAVFERACFDAEVLPDRTVHRVLDRITRTKVKLRQGRSSTWVPAPVDFSDLSSEYIGILYEGLLDFELKTAPAGDPVIFLAVGNQPALPLSRLEAMDDSALKNLLEKMKDTSTSADDSEEETEAEEPEEDEIEAVEGDDDETATEDEDEPEAEEADDEDERHTTRTRAETWARRAVEVGKLVKKPGGKVTPEKRLRYEEAVARKARQLVTRVVLPGESYLVRWGGTRKGSGTFYTRPGLAVPTVQRTLRPLAWDPPAEDGGEPNRDVPLSEWVPKSPEQILALKVVDPGCGSGTFPVAALRFLTDALYTSLHHHGRITEDGEKAVVRLLKSESGDGVPEERLADEFLPCRPDDETFEPRLKAILRRHVVERCIYGVDLDPLAVELCRLALWIETMDRELPFTFLDHKVKCGNALVGAWFDQFQHYPVMAWKNREGGDKGHSNGIHFDKGARTRALKQFVKDHLQPDAAAAIVGQKHIWRAKEFDPTGVHDQAMEVLDRLHQLPVHQSAERVRLFHAGLLGSEAYKELKRRMDLWCSCWYWPPEKLECAPLPTAFVDPASDTWAVVEDLSTENNFFHWELEFADVFRKETAGFDAVLGNPPWETLQPNPEEFFSNIDPLFRTYGRLVKNQLLRNLFEADSDLERKWLNYCAKFNNISHWVSFAANPSGDPEMDVGLSGSFALGAGNKSLHSRWRELRARSRGFADPRHPFRHQKGRVFTYRLFLECSHALLRDGGRIGMIVPSGLYTDSWSQPLRELFLDSCSWEWLFGFENREHVFDIDGRFKFNPIVVEKGGETNAIQTAFMRRRLEDWEHAESFAMEYSRKQVDRFSPHSRTILEIQNPKMLEVLEKIYDQSALLGEEGPSGWNLRYKIEFMMNTDARLFPPLPDWENQGYRPDEYSRWLKGEWRPIDDLWSELGFDPSDRKPIDSTCEAAIVARGNVVQRSKSRVRCAQPPYDSLPVARTDIPEGIILSREANEWIREGLVEDKALPFYEGRMIGQYDFSQKGWVSGKGRSATWREIDWGNKVVEPQYLIKAAILDESPKCAPGPQSAYMRISSATNARTTISTYLFGAPAGDSVFFYLPNDGSIKTACVVSGILSSLVFDTAIRLRLGGLNMSDFVMAEAPLPPLSPFYSRCSVNLLLNLSLSDRLFCKEWIHLGEATCAATSWKSSWALTDVRRLEILCCFDALIALWYGLEISDLNFALRDCDWPKVSSSNRFDPKGFWRVDRGLDPELRQTVLTLIAFHDLKKMISSCGDNQETGIQAFLTQHEREGWTLPETLRLADYGLGHDDRAQEYQPVASRLGPRFYDWQLAQTPEESWRECHLHARNLLGKAGYQRLLAEIEGKTGEESTDPGKSSEAENPNSDASKQGSLFS